MPRLVVWLGVLVLVVGCKSTDRDRTRDTSDRDHPPANPASRTKPAAPKSWLDGPNPGRDKVDTPPADSWADPRDPKYDVDREVRGVLGGFVEDPDGRKLRDVFIEVEQVDSGGHAVPVGVQTDAQGFFLIKGLKPRQTYQLTGRMTIDGKELSGRVYARTGTDRSQFIRLSLIEGLSFPGTGKTTSGGKDLPGAPGADKGLEPPTSAIPPPVLPTGPGLPAPVPRGPENSGAARPVVPGGDGGAWSPTAPVNSTPTTTAPAAPTTTGEAPRPPARPDLTATGPEGMWKPPAASIPTMPAPPSTAPAMPAIPPTKSQSRSVPAANRFVLLDTLGNQREFPSGRDNELILLDFMTTTCIQCRKIAPTIQSMQARYGLKGLEVVGVACDAVDLSKRRAVASAFQRSEGLNYLLYVEPTREPGKLLDRFGVEAYPTLVLIDGTGQVLWKGRSRDVADLEAILAQRLK